MADTLKFGPEWLRQLSGGNSVSTPPSPAPGFGKYKLAEYRYGREEMLALYTTSKAMPERLKEFGPVVTEKSQEPLALQHLSEEEQRIMSQSVNSQAVLRMMGRGTQPMRGRGISTGIDRGRGRGRGRGEAYVQRGMSYDEMDPGVGFGRPRQRPDGSWDEAGTQKTYQRPYNRFDESNPQNKVYQRSLSSENWRDREEDDDDGDWRKAGGSKWTARSSWREGGGRGGYEHERTFQNNMQKGFNPHQYRRSRSSESWEEEGELPEWSMDADPAEELGTFDASGVFVQNRHIMQKGQKFRRPDEELDGPRDPKEQRKAPSPTSIKKDKERGAGDADTDINENQTKTDNKEIPARSERGDNSAQSKRETSKSEKLKSAQTCDSYNKSSATDKGKSLSADKHNGRPSPSISPRDVDRGSSPQNKQQIYDGQKGKNVDTVKRSDETGTGPSKKANREKRDNIEGTSSKNTDNVVSSGSTNGAGNKGSKKDGRPAPESKRREKLKSEAEALDQLKVTAENIVAGIAIGLEDEEDKTEVAAATMGLSNKSPVGALPVDHENYSKWYYRDPQGDLQGPFSSSEMAEWFSAGYFTMSLNVRRGCDEKFSPLGELIRKWGRVPFLPGPTQPPPLMNSAHNSPDVSQQQQVQQQQQQQQQQEEQIRLQAQQQLILQHQMVQAQQQQMLLRQLQMQQLQSLQQLIVQLQENESFKALPPQQQQQLALQILLKQANPNNPVTAAAAAAGSSQVIPPQAQQSPKKLSPRPTDVPQSTSPTNMAHPLSSLITRSFSSPNPTQGPSSSIWDIEPSAMAPGITAAELEAQLKEKQEQEQQEAERKYKELVERQNEELRKKEEDIQRQKAEIERERHEMERKKMEELKKMEEERRKVEEKQRLEDEQRRKFEDEKRNRELEEKRRKEEERRQKDLERQKQQELLRQQEIQRLKEEEERKKQQQQQQQQQQQAEMQRRAEVQRQNEEAVRKQTEALRKLQQEQLANMQLPAHAQWASGGGLQQNNASKSLLEIQQQEEQERREREEAQRKQMEMQRQMMLLQQQQQQQQQKSWTNATLVGTQSTTKSLLEIQQEQARQLERERQKREENQHQAAKNMSLGAASVWSGSSSSWAHEGAWGAIKSSGQMGSTTTTTTNNNNLGFWDDAIISSSGPVKKQPNKSGKQMTDFPALGGDGKNRGKVASQNKPSNKPSKSKKEEEAVQRLFQSVKPEDDFSQWCERQLRNMATSVDIPTFVAFLQEVESPYEVHDYVRSYLGETKTAEDFGKAFLEKRSQYRNKTKLVEEDSIWGPAPAITPRELRQSSMATSEESGKSKANRKKKNKMSKVDASILGFTVHAAPDRIVGEIENVEVTGGAR